MGVSLGAPPLENLKKSLKMVRSDANDYYSLVVIIISHTIFPNFSDNYSALEQKFPY